MILCTMLFLLLKWLTLASVVANSQEKSKTGLANQNVSLPYNVKIRE